MLYPVRCVAHWRSIPTRVVVVDTFRRQVLKEPLVDRLEVGFVEGGIRRACAELCEPYPYELRLNRLAAS
jgi:hypothetical protein